MFDKVDLVENLSIGSGSNQLLKRSLWSCGELSATEDWNLNSDVVRSGVDDEVCVVGSYFDC